MWQTNKEACKKCEIEIIEDEKCFWINRRELETESDYDNWTQTFDKFDPKKQKYRQELISNAKFQQCRLFVRKDLLQRKIKSCRKALEKFLTFKKKLGLDPYKIACD